MTYKRFENTKWVFRSRKAKTNDNAMAKKGKTMVDKNLRRSNTNSTKFEDEPRGAPGW
jgi:hypothetical protein